MKLKTHRGLAKRVKITATGKVLSRRAGKRHLLSKKSATRKRRYDLPAVIHPTNRRVVRALLPYGV